ncbi:hypothetical protein RB195_000945 [Necator americanus]|uniref:Phlebovirus glycoprotein G2 fusion domain-containing protein n=1 Tax=Necator americanus TaxID=51031 RepID=A0ABR1DC25_NECAM
MCTCVCKTGECNKDAFHDELNVLTTKIRSQQKVTVGIDANGNMGLEQQSDVPRKGTKLCDPGAFTKCIHNGAKETLSVQQQQGRKSPLHSSVEVKLTQNSAFAIRSTVDFNQEKRLRKEVALSTAKGPQKKWTSGAKEIENAWGKGTGAV